MNTTRLREICEAAARGSFPVPQWCLEFVPRPSPLLGAVVAFTGHHVVAADVGEDEARSHLDPEDIAAPFNPAFLAWLGDRLGARVGHIDVTLARLGSGVGDHWLIPTTEPPDNERVRRAEHLRSDVRFFSSPNDSAVVTLGVGLAGRLELSLEVNSELERNAGLGRHLVQAAVARIPTDQAVFAGVAPGNSRSLRCLLHADFVPIGAECLLSRASPR